MDKQQNIIIYRTVDLFATSKPNISMHTANMLKESELVESSVVKNFLTTAVCKKWLNQQQMAELFATSKQLISHHIANILKKKELNGISVVK